MSFSKILKDWYQQNARDLPWRHTSVPYEIWISEIILQQTQVVQGTPYYYRFLEKFPNVETLAEADESEVLKVWQGLGYYSRARNLHFTAKYIVNNYNGVFPSDYKDILNLKGIGEYTAAAISSFCYGLPYAVLDGNVARLLSRYFGLESDIDSSEGKKILRQKSQLLLDVSNPAIHNQAIMEFGALQCKKMSPECSMCVLKSKCISYQTDLVHVLPIKKKTKKKKERYFNYLIIKHNKKILLNRRTSGIWESLYEFPLIEGNLSLEEMTKTRYFRSLFQHQVYIVTNSSSLINHKLSHQIIHARFIHFTVSDIIKSNFINIQIKDIHNYPVPILIDKYIKSTII